jgi:pyrroloquinoline quinone (PQQ) biosynthesis protein C
MMLGHDYQFSRPMLRPGARVSVDGDRVRVDYRRHGCTIRTVGAGSADVTAVLTDLQSGLRRADLVDRHPQVGPEALGALIERLDDLGLITEADGALPPGVTSGEQFYRRVRRFGRALAARRAGGAFLRALEDGTATRAQVVGYALEYYHIVHMCPALVAPALANHESPRTRDLLRDFYRTEFDHDRMLQGALAAIGIDRERLDAVIPLPTTFAQATSLAAYARVNPLAFKTCLYLFEVPAPRFQRALRERCQQLALPEAFWKPFLEHSDINEDAGHDDISRVLLREIGAVTEEEQVTTLIAVGALIETFVAQETEILHYYGDPRNPIPRIFP